MASIKSADDEFEQEDFKLCLFSEFESLDAQVESFGFEGGFDDVIRLPPRQECVYTSCYCEENVWILINEVRKTQPHLLGTVYAVFVSNENQIIPLWEQKVGHGDDKVVFWDYHVFLLYYNGQRSAVYDLDSILPFPTDFNVYSSKAIRSNRKILPQYHRKFRVVPGKVYLQTFSSNRSHMRKADGTYKSPPPDYSCVQVDDCINNITDFISMDPSLGVGKIMTVPQFFLKFTPMKNK